MPAQQDHFSYSLGPNSGDSQQAQPWALILIIHFLQPNTIDLPSIDFALKPVSEKNPSGSSLYSDDVAMQHSKILIRSDILNVSTSTSKRSMVGSASATLVPGNYEYENVVLPGDHAFIWMGNEISKLQEIVDNIKNNKSANDFLSGLKFYGRVESCQKIFSLNGNKKSIRYNINFKSFSEFNSQVYFNPYLRNANPDSLAFYAQLSKNYTEMFAKTGIVTPQQAIKFLLNIFLGTGPENRAKGIVSNDGENNKTQRSPVNAYMIPKAAGEVLGQTQPSKGARLTYVDVLNTLIGVQRYSTETQFDDDSAAYEGFIPILSDETINTRQRECVDALKGVFPRLPDLFNNNSLISIIENLVNTHLNEMFLTLRTDEKGAIMPTLVARQIPFTTDRFHKAFPQTDATDFLELPRWVIGKGLRLGNYNIGTSDVLRINFVQFYGTLFNSGISAAQSMASQSSDQSFKEDRLDILRNGGRNAIVTSNVLIDTQAGSVVPEKVSEYASLVTDWYVNGQLKLTGSITLPGIVEPICVGDNLEFDGKVFHMEDITHEYSVDGIYKSFNTSISLVNGINSDGTYAYASGQSIDDQNEQYGRTNETSGEKSDFKEVSVGGTNVTDLLSSITNSNVLNKLLKG